MKAKKIRKLKVVAIVVAIVAIVILGRYIVANIQQTIDDRVQQAIETYNSEQMEYARDTGYKQSCVEIAYYFSMISDIDYQKYLDISEKYTENPNAQTLKKLSELVNKLIKDLPMWDDLINNTI